MPSTRRELSREEKMGDIVTAAARRLGEGGYNAVSIAGIARELGIAHNAVYWYFPSKDDLVVAAFRHKVHELMARKPKDSGDVVERVMWFVERLGKLYPVRASLHSAARDSPVIAAYLDELSSRLNELARHVLAGYVDADELDVAAASFIATVQGAFLEGIPPKERRRLLTFSLRRLIGQ
jgi:AcrR family transcriptional regulator